MAQIVKKDGIDIFADFNINGDNTVGFVDPKFMKSQGWMDKSKVRAYMQNEEDQKAHTKDLGMIQLFRTSHQVRVPMLMDVMQKSAVIEIPSGGRLTYDLPIQSEGFKTYTIEDTSLEYPNPGIDKSIFAVTLNTEYTKGDFLTFDPTSGVYAVVSDEHEVEQYGEGFKHYVSYYTNDPLKTFPRHALKAGIRWMKVTHPLAEYDTTFSSPSLVLDTPGFMTNEFILGSPIGIETFYTAQAGNMSSNAMAKTANAFINSVDQRMQELGGKARSMFMIGNSSLQGGKAQLNQRSIKIGDTLDYLALMELAIMECYSCMFNKAGEINSANGIRRTTEGLWHQLRRGKIISYSKPGGITIAHLADASEYIFGNHNVPLEERRLKFKAGHNAAINMDLLMQKYSHEYLAGIPSLIVGNQGVGNISNQLVTGDLMNLTVNPMKIKEAFLPGVGYVSVEHDPSFDYLPNVDRTSAGFVGRGGYHKYSHSLIITDATDTYYSNLVSKIRGGDLVEGGYDKTNIYYVKPEGPNRTWGHKQGRMNDGNQFGNISSALNYMGREFWALVESGVIVLDTTRSIIIELQDTQIRY